MTDEKNRCCNQPSCRRTQPLLLMRDPNVNTWFLVDSYSIAPDGHLAPWSKHDLPQDAQNALTDMAYAQMWLLTVTNLLECAPNEVLHRLGLSPAALGLPDPTKEQ